MAEIIRFDKKTTLYVLYVGWRLAPAVRFLLKVCDVFIANN